MSLANYRNSYSPISLFEDFFSDNYSSIMPPVPLSFYSNLDSQTMNQIPKANIYYNSDKGYAIELAVPGHSRDEFKLNVENGVVTVGLDKEASVVHNEVESIRRREWSYSGFKRSFTLPESVSLDQIRATYDAGILRIEVPTTVENTTKRIIEVE